MSRAHRRFCWFAQLRFGSIEQNSPRPAVPPSAFKATRTKSYESESRQRAASNKREERAQGTIGGGTTRIFSHLGTTFVIVAAAAAFRSASMSFSSVFSGFGELSRPFKSTRVSQRLRVSSKLRARPETTTLLIKSSQKAAPKGRKSNSSIRRRTFAQVFSRSAGVTSLKDSTMSTGRPEKARSNPKIDSKMGIEPMASASKCLRNKQHTSGR